MTNLIFDFDFNKMQSSIINFLKTLDFDSTKLYKKKNSFQDELLFTYTQNDLTLTLECGYNFFNNTISKDDVILSIEKERQIKSDQIFFTHKILKYFNEDMLLKLINENFIKDFVLHVNNKVLYDKKFKELNIECVKLSYINKDLKPFKLYLKIPCVYSTIEEDATKTEFKLVHKMCIFELGTKEIFLFNSYQKTNEYFNNKVFKSDFFEDYIEDNKIYTKSYFDYELKERDLNHIKNFIFSSDEYIKRFNIKNIVYQVKISSMFNQELLKYSSVNHVDNESFLNDFVNAFLFESILKESEFKQDFNKVFNDTLKEIEHKYKNDNSIKVNLTLNQKDYALLKTLSKYFNTPHVEMLRMLLRHLKQKI